MLFMKLVYSLSALKVTREETSEKKSECMKHERRQKWFKYLILFNSKSLVKDPEVEVDAVYQKVQFCECPVEAYSKMS